MDEPEILIRAPRLTPELTQLQERILEQKVATLAFYKDRSEYFLDVASILFFETDGEKIFGHTKDEAYEVKQKLYELEELLPIAFCRISKSTIVNAKQIYSLEILSVDGHEKHGQYVSSHLHLNVTYLVEADPAAPIRPKPDENSRVGWFTPEGAMAASSEPWFRERIYRKLNEKLKNF